jgi:ATP-dependent RNA helicase RhlB
LQGLDAVGFEYCTPIQAQTLPPLLKGEDVAGQAQTGSGKTAAFVLATLQKLLAEPPEANVARHPRALILAPTRELAMQVHKDAVQLGHFSGLRFGLAFGGIDYDLQRDTLAAGVDVIIGTPGRLIDYFKQRVFSLKHIQVLVIDEADRMFDLGFIKDIRYLLRRLPPPGQRLSMLFSATLSLRVTELAYEHMNNPGLVKIDPERVTAETVTEVLYHADSGEKLSLLLGLLQRDEPGCVLIFVNTKRAADRVVAALNAHGYQAGALSGDVPQKRRLQLIRRFGDGELHILVATDVAARGLHIPVVTHVINYDLPQNAEDYVHRIGRTARAGAAGDAISLACEEYVFSLGEIEGYIGHKIPVAPLEAALLVPIKGGHDAVRRSGPPRPDQRRPRRGPRPSEARPGSR